MAINLNEIVVKPWVPSVIAAVSGLFVGCGVGYVIGRKQQSNRTQDNPTDPHIVVDPQLKLFDTVESALAADAELASYEKHDQAPYLTQDEAIDALYSHRWPDWELELDAEASIVEDELENAPPAVKNIFGTGGDDWDYEKERSERSEQEPYVLHVDEFSSGESGYAQGTLVFYAGDEKVADGEDVPIYNWKALLGELKFGHGSNDPTVVYIRNESVEREWEIFFHEGAFDVVVGGLAIEDSFDKNDLRHTRHHPRPKDWEYDQ